jgi:hypothetical protein
MKLKLRTICVAIASVVMLYAGCKKSSTNSSGPALAPQDVASQVALNISQSLFGGLGFDLSDGLNSPASFAVRSNSKGKLLQSVTNPDCGLVVDTTLTYTGAANGGSATIAGTIKFSFSCTNDVVSGFTTNDNLSITLASPDLNLTYKVAENLTLLAINPSDPNSNLNLSGTLNSNANYQINTGTKGSGTQVFNYALKSLILDSNDGTVISGSATFTTSGTGPRGVWNYTGSIVFLANDMASVTINGKVYTVNLQTGAVS